jgi:hypothetical protein
LAAFLFFSEIAKAFIRPRFKRLKNSSSIIQAAHAILKIRQTVFKIYL